MRNLYVHPSPNLIHQLHKVCLVFIIENGSIAFDNDIFKEILLIMLFDQVPDLKRVLFHADYSLKYLVKRHVYQSILCWLKFLVAVEALVETFL